MNALRQNSWNPYFVGIFIGILSWFSFWSADHALGITTAFEHTAGIVLKPLAPSLLYFSKKLPKIDWEWALVLGVFLGAFLSSKMSGDRPQSSVPPIWRRRFGDSVKKRMVGAFTGGFIMMYGARIAEGCTSGHGISGVLQFALASWVFVPVFGLAGIVTARLIYKAEKR